MTLFAAWLVGWQIMLFGFRFFDWGFEHVTLTGWKRIHWAEVEHVQRQRKEAWWMVEFLEIRGATGKVTINLEQFKDRDALLLWMHDRLVETNPRFRDEADSSNPEA